VPDAATGREKTSPQLEWGTANDEVFPKATRKLVRMEKTEVVNQKDLATAKCRPGGRSRRTLRGSQLSQAEDRDPIGRPHVHPAIGDCRRDEFVAGADLVLYKRGLIAVVEFS